MGEAGRCLLPIGVVLRILDWTAMRGGYGVCIVFDDCLGCGRMETFDLGVGGAMPSTPASLLNAVTGIRLPSSGAFAVLAVIRDLGSQEQRGMALKDRRIHLCGRQTICGPHS